MTKTLQYALAILALALSFYCISSGIQGNDPATPSITSMPRFSMNPSECEEIEFDYIDDEYGPLQFDGNQWRSEENGLVLGFSAAEDSIIYDNPNCV
jgi:hypothetical protein